MAKDIVPGTYYMANLTLSLAIVIVTRDSRRQRVNKAVS